MDAVQSNYQYIKSKILPGSVLYAVVKSDAYGHGIQEIGKVLSAAGCRYFAVDEPREGIKLRNVGIDGEILLMNPIPEWMSEIAVRNDLSVSVIHNSILDPLEEAAARMQKVCRIHFNVNLGLHRMGISPSKLLKVAREAFSKSHLKLEGLFGQPRDPESALEGYETLKKQYEHLIHHGMTPKHLHFSNSTTFLALPETARRGLRIGILIYGVLPPEQYRHKSVGILIKPAMRCFSELVQLRTLSKGSPIGYRSRSHVGRDTLVGTIPLGFSHGLDRKMTNSCAVLIRGQRAPLVGSISMNAAMVDVTDIPDIKIGDQVVVIGRQGNQEVDINDLAEGSGTIAAELMMRFGRGIPRHYSYGNHGELHHQVLIQQDESDIDLRYFQTEKDLPAWLNIHDIIHFIEDHSDEDDLSIDEIGAAIEYALSTKAGGSGFLLVGTRKKRIAGLIVMIQTKTQGFLPENVIMYLSFNSATQQAGLITRLINEAVQSVQGDVTVRITNSEDTRKIYIQAGFVLTKMEVLLKKGAVK